jgi:phage-related protein
MSGNTSNLETVPFDPASLSSYSVTASSTITATAPSSFIAEKNAFTQNPVVRLYNIYYPGEWYPPNEAGNPTNQGAGYAWPNPFPVRFAEIIGDLATDISYNVTFNATTYTPFPVNMSGLAQGSDGKINEASLTVFNVDNLISVLVENPYLVGINTSDSVSAYVNGELVTGIDPRTVPGNPSYDSTVVAAYGGTNSAFTYEQAQSIGGDWVPLKTDTRDLLGGVVEVKTTFANFLDVWPEYSLIDAINSNIITVKNSLPYRVGDNVRSSSGSSEATITELSLDHNITLSGSIDANVGDALYIVNQEADTESYLQDTLKIDQLESLSDFVATFGLVSWLQYFKIVTPKRKYYKNTCQWAYKGSECQYPGPGNNIIPGTTLQANSNPIALDNTVAASADLDACSKSFTACELRNNTIHFGGFSGTGRTIPKN